MADKMFFPTLAAYEDSEAVLKSFDFSSDEALESIDASSLRKIVKAQQAQNKAFLIWAIASQDQANTHYHEAQDSARLLNTERKDNQILSEQWKAAHEANHGLIKQLEANRQELKESHRKLGAVQQAADNLSQEVASLKRQLKKAKKPQPVKFESHALPLARTMATHLL